VKKRIDKFFYRNVLSDFWSHGYSPNDSRNLVRLQDYKTKEQKRVAGKEDGDSRQTL